MKKIFLMLGAISMAAAANATINGNGFYRVQNYGSQRWASLIDNQGSADLVSGTADLHALQLNKDFNEIVTDPGSIIYLTNISGKEYNVSAQGTSLESLVGHSIFIGNNGTANNQTLYRIWGTYSNVTKYIMDGQFNTTKQYGEATILDLNSTKYKQWLFIPVEASSDNYFAAVPTVNANGGLYTSLFTSFGYKPYSSGVKAYYIGRVGFGMAEMVEISGSVPPGSPVIIKCASSEAAGNKLELTGNQDALPSNALNGVYFNYSSSSAKNHVAYDPKTMRVLGTCTDGSLGFITSNIDYIPANTAYMKVPEGSAPELKCVSTEEYEANLPEAPEGFYSGQNIILFPEDEYTYSGSWEIPAMENGGDLKILLHAGSATKAGTDVIGVLQSYGKDYNLDLSQPVKLPFSYGSPYSWVIPNWKGGNLTISLNLLYQYINFSCMKAGVESLVTGDSVSLRYIGQMVYGSEGVLINVYNLAGHLVANSSSGEIDLSHLPKGIYIAKSGNKSIKINR